MTPYRIRVSSEIGGERVPSATTVGFFTGSDMPNPRPLATPDVGVFPATGSGLALAALAGGLLLAGTRLTRVARRSD